MLFSVSSEIQSELIYAVVQIANLLVFAIIRHIERTALIESMKKDKEQTPVQ